MDIRNFFKKLGTSLQARHDKHTAKKAAATEYLVHTRDLWLPDTRLRAPENYVRVKVVK